MFCVSLRYVVEQVYFYNKLIYTPCVHECWMNKQFIPKTCWYTFLLSNCREAYVGSKNVHLDVVHIDLGSESSYSVC
jgi:hypothetical protein